MIYGTCVFLYALRHHARPPKQRSLLYISFLVLTSVLVTVIYLVWKNPLFHQASYGLLVFLLLYEAIVAVKNYPEIKSVVIASACFYSLGFVLWNIDNVFCSSLRSIRQRHSSKAILQTGTQLHAWWHIFTGYGTYLHIIFSSYARSLHLKKTCRIKLLDELPMIYGSCIYIYSLKTVEDRPKTINYKWLIAALVYSSISTVIYTTKTNPLLFQFFYGLILICLVHQVVSTSSSRPSLRPLTIASVLFYFVGFSLWIVDIQYCSWLRLARSHSTSLYDVVTLGSQFHAWWHVLAGLASYLQVHFGVFARCQQVKIPCHITTFLGWPYVRVKTIAD